jgi:hypothetical protein
MKRTILTSLLFLYPINISYKYRDLLMLNMNTLGMAISLINHSHSFHGDNFRRRLFGFIDQKYMMFFGLFVSYRCLYKSPSIYTFIRVFGNMAIIFYIYFYLLEGRKQKERSIESYTESQKNIHMLLHFFAIVGLTQAYKKYYIKKF